MGPVEALKLALTKEVDAVELYAKLSIEAPVARDIFLFLVGEEQKHKLLIEKKILELTK
jgi:rubrerythrin